jgi:uncharacterized protein GlcG (DUF336 family)
VRSSGGPCRRLTGRFGRDGAWLLGAIGVSGGEVEQDRAVAEAGAAACA